MLSHMTPHEFVERMAYAKLMAERVAPDADGGHEIAADDPDFARKFLGGLS